LSVPATGWLGYNFIVNRAGVQPHRTVLERSQGGRYRWGSPVSIECRAGAGEIELAIPQAALGIKARPAVFDFKWADNIQQTGDWSDFNLNGDAAPNDRFNYRAHLEAPAD
jgi:hypothetical protein